MEVNISVLSHQNIQQQHSPIVTTTSMPISNALERNRNNSKTLTISWTKTISKEIKMIIKFIVGTLVCNYLDLRISFVSCSYIGKGHLFSLWKHRHLYQIKLYDRRNRESLALIMSHFVLSKRCCLNFNPL